MPARRPIETAFQIRKDDVGGTELVLDQREWRRRIGDIHQIDVAGKNHLGRHLSPLSLARGDDSHAGGETPQASRLLKNERFNAEVAKDTQRSQREPVALASSAYPLRPPRK